MTRIPTKTCKVLTCKIVCGQPELNYITGFNDLFQKIIEAKKFIFFDFDVKSGYLK